MKGRCFHQTKLVCPSCRGFAKSLVGAIDARNVAWTPGIMGRLNRAARGAR